jgi:hypothetical protein
MQAYRDSDGAQARNYLDPAQIGLILRTGLGATVAV